MSLKSSSQPSENSQPKADNAKSSSVPPSAREIIGTAWKLVTKYPSMTVASFLVQLPLTYALSQLPEDMSARFAFQAHSWYDMLISGFLTFGVYRCALGAVRNGRPCSFSKVFSDGSDCWGRNFRLSWVLGFYILGLMMAVGLPVLLISVLAKEFIGEDFALISAGALGLIGLVWALRIVMRLSLSAAWLADTENGFRASSQKATQESLSMTRGRSLGPIFGAFGMSVLGYAVLFLLSFGTYSVLADSMDGYISYETAALTDIALSLPTAFISVWTSCMFAVAYLRYSAASGNPAR